MMDPRIVFASLVATGLLWPGIGFAQDQSLWSIYENTLKSAKYIDLTHAFEPVQPVWPGFANARFKPSVAGRDIEGYVKAGEEFTYDKHGFVATAYDLTTDQYGTQLDPPSHWNPLGATISDIPPSFAVRPLVVIDISGKVKTDPGYHLQIADIKEWEQRHGQVPQGSVVFVRSDWYR
ncbi:MAG: cyclase family protein, partial [Phyllobacterium sp.]